jgi:hypothetical protein
MNNPIKFGSNRPSGLREEDLKQTTPFMTPVDLLFLFSSTCTFNKLQQKKHYFMFLIFFSKTLGTKLGMNVHWMVL